MRFLNQLAIVTGASDGIGRATALLLAREGAQVVLNARGAARLATVGKEIRAVGKPPLLVRGDLARPATIECLVNTALDATGRIDVLVNNAGGSAHRQSFDETTLGDWRKTMHANLQAVFFLTQAVVRVMRRQRSGRIVNVSSLAGRNRSRLSGCDYAAAKAGVLALTRQLAWELGPLGIMVNAVAPGITLTDRVGKLWRKRSARYRAEILANIPLRRLAQPEEVAQAVAFLASAEASYLTGVTVDVNGGAFMG